MGTGILVCGCNGSGKSTLGKQLAKELHYHFIDIETLYFPKINADYVYSCPRSRSEVEKRLLDEVQKYENFVLAAVKGNLGEKILTLYKYVIVLSAPKKVRLQRVRNRSFQKFGDRILPGGDLYERETEFFDMAAKKSEQDIETWTNSLNCPIIRIDGTRNIAENVELIKKMIR